MISVLLLLRLLWLLSFLAYWIYDANTRLLPQIHAAWPKQQGDAIIHIVASMLSICYIFVLLSKNSEKS